MTIEVDESTARALDELRRRAAARQMSVDAFVAWLVQSSDTVANSGVVNPDEFDRLLDELTSDLPDLERLPPDFSRRDIYDGHD